MGFNSVFECLLNDVRVVVTGVVSVVLNVVIDSDNAFIGLPVKVDS